ncbi:MAG TPA: alkene reductase [Bacteriovoracaceae bacterium]|nr:alkene reductase [Bacteriovoracaceae bacterium]
MSLFSPIKLGDIELDNRIIMAPLTRSRAPEHKPNDLMVKYYQQRSGAGMILTEATVISKDAIGYENTPGIWTEDQIAGWKKVVNAVHEKKGKIVMQLWHVGRVSHSSLLEGKLPVAPSPVPINGLVRRLGKETPYETPRELTLPEIKEIISQYKRAAENAKKAGFDGVELHGANGYLVDQFIHDGTNKRNDEYGGSVEKRSRFLFEVLNALIEVWGSGRVGLHLSPYSNTHDVSDSNPDKLFEYIFTKLNDFNLSFVFIRNTTGSIEIYKKIRSWYQGNIIGNQNYSFDTASMELESGLVDAVSFGRWFISNPDLVEKFKDGRPLTPWNEQTFYSGGELGYTDY